MLVRGLSVLRCLAIASLALGIVVWSSVSGGVVLDFSN